jgi:hypothetical protein
VERLELAGQNRGLDSNWTLKDYAFDFIALFALYASRDKAALSSASPTCAVKRSFRSVRFDVRRSICSEALRRCRRRKLCPGPAKVTVLAPNAKFEHGPQHEVAMLRIPIPTSLPATRFLAPRLRFLPWHLNALNRAEKFGSIQS